MLIFKLFLPYPLLKIQWENQSVRILHWVKQIFHLECLCHVSLFPHDEEDMMKYRPFDTFAFIDANAPLTPFGSKF
jgi:hypothetical protein